MVDEQKHIQAEIFPDTYLPDNHSWPATVVEISDHGRDDVARVYPLPDDPERCLDDFLDVAAEHARRMAERLGRQEASVQRFLELSGEDHPDTA